MIVEMDFGSGRIPPALTVLKWAMTPVALRSTSKQHTTIERVPAQRSSQPTTVLVERGAPGNQTGTT